MPAAAGNSYGSTTVSCIFDNLAQREQLSPQHNSHACRAAPKLHYAAGLQQALHVQQLVGW